MNQNDAFSEALLNVYILEVFNPKGCIYSQLHGHYHLKQYKKSPQPLFYIFIFVYFSILSKAMMKAL
jgi:hypothetical protein